MREIRRPNKCQLFLQSLFRCKESVVILIIIWPLIVIFLMINFFLKVVIHTTPWIQYMKISRKFIDLSTNINYERANFPLVCTWFATRHLIKSQCGIVWIAHTHIEQLLLVWGWGHSLEYSFGWVRD